jgi:DUF1680 family protein
MRISFGSGMVHHKLAVLGAIVLVTTTAAQQTRRIVQATPRVAESATPLPLDAVRLTGGPLARAQQLDAQYLLALEPDRMLSFYRTRAGLTKKAEPYGGWDGEGRQLTGHIAGHYLSAVSYMYAATGDVRFKQRADYIVDELKIVQDAHRNGYLGAIMNGEAAFNEVASGNIKSSAFDLNGLWSPWYTLHKTYAGLRDAYRYTGNRTALDIEIKYAEWAESILSRLNDQQTQKMLGTEFGGMNEVLVDLYADTADRRWLDLSYHFEYRAVVDPWKEHEDDLNGLHGNATIPKAIGSLARFIYTGDLSDGFGSAFFWDRVVKHHTFATGGHGKDEYFREPDKLGNIFQGRTAESCNVYNMLKLTRELFALRPDEEYAAFQERALFNHVLGSIDPEDGSTCYMVPVGQGVRREYQSLLPDGSRQGDFTCCVGTGMENHALHGLGLYYVSPQKLWVNVYAPSTAEWSAESVALTMDTTFPEGDTARLTLTLAAPRTFTVAMRRPQWAGEGFAVKINGEVAGPDSLTAGLPGPGSYLQLKRAWKTGDTIELAMPKTLRLERLVNDPHRAAIMWGPLMLAGDLGPEPPRTGRGAAPAREIMDMPVIVSAGDKPADWVKPVADKPGNFRMDGVGKPRDIELVPFYRLHRHVYMGYFDVYTPADWKKKSEETIAALDHERKLEAATIAYATPGATAQDLQFHQQGENASVTRMDGRTGRGGRGWFSYDMPVESAHQNVLVVTYHADSRRPRTFDILIDGQPLAQERLEAASEDRFFDREYEIPLAQIPQGKATVTIRFQATGGNDIAAVFGLRMVRR